MAQARVDQSLVRLNESISLLERQMEGGRKGIEQVLHAEITSRYIYLTTLYSLIFYFWILTPPEHSLTDSLTPSPPHRPTD